MVCAVSVHFGTTNLIVVGDYSHEHTEGGGGGYLLCGYGGDNSSLMSFMHS